MANFPPMAQHPDVVWPVPPSTPGTSGPPLASTTPAAVGEAGAVGVSTDAARADHIHKGFQGAPSSVVLDTLPRFSNTAGDAVKSTGVGVTDDDALVGVDSVTLDALSNDTAPGSGVRVYMRSLAGRSFLTTRDVLGTRAIRHQTALMFSGAGYWRPSITTTISTLGLPLTNTGTVAHGTLAATSLLTSTNRWRMALAAAGVVGNRTNVALCWRGNSAGLGGFTLAYRVAFTTVGANAAFFGGVMASAAALVTASVPTAQVNCIAAGFNLGQTTLRIMHNDASGACTTIDLGASFPVNVTTAFYTVLFHCRPNGSSVFYCVIREDTGTIAEGVITTDLPANNIFLAPQLSMGNNNVAEACAYECAGLTLEKDY